MRCGGSALLASLVADPKIVIAHLPPLGPWFWADFEACRRDCASSRAFFSANLPTGITRTGVGEQLRIQFLRCERETHFF